MAETENWYILKIKSRKEIKTAEVLRMNNIEVMLPLQTIRKKYSDRIKKIKTPLFTNYLFVKRTPENRNDVFITNDITGYLFVAHNIARLQPFEVTNINSLCSEETDVQIVPGNYYQNGCKIIVQAGPFTGMTGEVIKDTKADYLIVSFPTLNSFAKIKIERKYLIAV